VEDSCSTYHRTKPKVVMYEDFQALKRRVQLLETAKEERATKENLLKLSLKVERSVYELE